ncbi:site-specific DNA-methyltransferase [Streptococcus suis]|uniref:Type III restriction-modification system methylation subunit n=1 Tax=Streptococcus suis TaxID=1307 RepID=A0A0Z8JR95_STRSU|nr:site-specific DNA-methyltransferase [Streptococcus suis]NQH18251.1 site-specific DNA-methyltransferase [Streptococcus suis]NQJ48910.1 site-specific DNA-methyltransferase [Streptococcus suis]NQJ55333.1 site-specific DNA-methyltransferase [Streptococcus suis]CYV58510.1 type III restriction-modification system methylation subunit [Streptococcus suis]HEM4388699.1 site-specific DNA-methyltransferase [Streptococcus suis]
MPKDFNELPRQNEKNEALDYVKALIDQARIDGRNEDVVQLDKIIKLLNRKKYGLVWEEHAELVEEEMKTRIPVFIEDETRKIRANPEDKDYNFILEGDNLHSLHLLEKTHAGRIDVIYIDPPYNTGNKDFKYNDKFVDKTDGYAHSKWLSFMSKRLEIARRLLSDTGVIFISIDDKEQAQLKLLCDEVFGNRNFIAQLVWEKKKKPSFLNKNLGSKFEYILCYSRNRDYSIPFSVEFTKMGKKYPLNNAGNSAMELYFSPNSVHFSLPDGIVKAQDMSAGNIITKLKNDVQIKCGKNQNAFTLYGEWRYSQAKLNEIIQNNEKLSISKVPFRPNHHKQGGEVKKIHNLLTQNYYDVGTNEDASLELMKLVGDKIFDFPKPSKLIKFLVRATTYNNKTCTVLDFFAGSGTTGHAVAQLNKEDGGNRKYILCTNNENNICEEVTYKRLTNIQDDLPHNLKYFKTKFLSKDDEELEFSLLHHVHTLIELEHGIDLKESDKATAFSLSELRKLDLSGIKTVYVRQQSHAMMEKSDLVRFEGIELIDVPEYYFAKEMREAGL